MGELTIQIDWVYFLGIFAVLLTIAWHSGSRFSKIETHIEWLIKSFSEVKKRLDDIKVDTENRGAKAFATNSPVKLTPRGDELLVKSGLKEYVESNKERLVNHCKAEKCDNAYEVQECIFNLFDSEAFKEPFDTRLKNFAYEQGLSLEILRRIGAIYCRDVALEEFHMDVKDIDSQAPLSNR